MHAFTFGGTPVDQRLRETGFYLLIFRSGGLFQTRRGTIDSRAQRITDALHLVMTTATTAMALDTITNSHILLAAPQRLQTFLFPTNVDFHTGEQQQFFTPITGTPLIFAAK